MNDTYSIKSLLFELSTKDKEIIDLKKLIKELSYKIEVFENDNEYMKNKLNRAFNDEKLIKTLTESNDQLEREKENLINEIKSKDKTEIDDIDNKNRKTEEIIQKLRFHIESMNVKIESAVQIEKLCNAQHDEIISLKNQLISQERKFKERAETCQIEFDIKKDIVKRSTMDQIGILKKRNDVIQKNHIGLSTTLTTLQNQQLIIELEYQSKLIEDLIGKKDELEKTVLTLKTDIKTHHKLHDIMKEKIRKLKTIIEKFFVNKVDELEDESNLIEVKSPIASRKSKKDKTIMTNHKSSLNMPIKNKINFISLSDSNKINFYKKIKQLETDLSNKKTEYDILKLNHDLYKEKLTNYEKKYKNIHDLFDEALKKLSDDKTLKQMSQINLTELQIINGDFNYLSNVEKYTILCSLINLLIPLFPKENDKGELNKKQCFIKFKYKFLQKEDSFLTSASSNNKTKYAFQFPKAKSTSNKELIDKRFEFSKMSSKISIF